MRKKDIKGQERIFCPVQPGYASFTIKLQTEKLTQKFEIRKGEIIMARKIRYNPGNINIEAVTEEHDPNGQLNKPGGYIGCIYFLDENVNRSDLIIEPGKDNTIDIGTKGGGAVEIYATEEDARNRDTYLADFDGTIYTSGSHAIVGTCVVRTSGILTSEQQLTLTNQIIEKLLMMEE